MQAHSTVPDHTETHMRSHPHNLMTEVKVKHCRAVKSCATFVLRSLLGRKPEKPCVRKPVSFTMVNANDFRKKEPCCHSASSMDAVGKQHHPQKKAVLTHSKPSNPEKTQPKERCAMERQYTDRDRQRSSTALSTRKHDHRKLMQSKSEESIARTVTAVHISLSPLSAAAASAARSRRRPAANRPRKHICHA
ncbi:uncharacterized protein BYT42DRAFT_582595 [Radiomyces spectabilis]|uniref:uncharacterized protein n=1 Tax=Radiomyces spectabilis TaxID=64574 RepID=UPI00221E837D|nr:uncharacterized protein BYT42DRAFT_582595 [Radiomyces spectabilis]KAI8370487.1 hypothetical protein BYT42DRAFT_582595 [Radiomyces spectabilis]